MKQETQFQIRRIAPDEWRILRDIRLKALKSDLFVFGSTYDAERDKTETDWRRWLENPESAVFLLFDALKPIGITGINYDWDDPTRRTAYLWGSWIEPAYRGRRLSGLLYRARLDWARDNPAITNIVVSHRASNLASKHANQRYGFVHTHNVPKTWLDGVTEDNVMYRKFIRPPWGDFPIESERLLFRPPAPGDGLIIQEGKLETLEQLKLWMPWAHLPQSVEADEAMIVEQADKHARGEDCMLFGFDKKTGKLAISTGLHRPDWAKREFEIGYWVPASMQGKGYAQEATRHLTKHAFDALGAKAVTVCHKEGNDASRAVIEKCGFAFTHEKRDDKDGALTQWYAIRT